MSELPSWPPPPEMPNLLTAHDEFLSACVRNSTPKQPLSRLRLVRDLRQETGQDLRSCIAVVNNFCDRHAILLPARGFVVLLGFVLLLFMLAMIAAASVTELVLRNSHDAAATHAERVAITSERIHFDFVLLDFYLLATGISVFLMFLRQKQARAEAAEARAKFTR